MDGSGAVKQDVVQAALRKVVPALEDDAVVEYLGSLAVDAVSSVPAAGDNSAVVAALQDALSGFLMEYMEEDDVIVACTRLVELCTPKQRPKGRRHTRRPKRRAREGAPPPAHPHNQPVASQSGAQAHILPPPVPGAVSSSPSGAGVVGKSLKQAPSSPGDTSCTSTAKAATVPPPCLWKPVLAESVIVEGTVGATRKVWRERFSELWRVAGVADPDLVTYISNMCVEVLEEVACGRMNTLDLEASWANVVRETVAPKVIPLLVERVREFVEDMLAPFVVLQDLCTCIVNDGFTILQVALHACRSSRPWRSAGSDERKETQREDTDGAVQHGGTPADVPSAAHPSPVAPLPYTHSDPDGGAPITPPEDLVRSWSDGSATALGDLAHGVVPEEEMSALVSLYGGRLSVLTEPPNNLDPKLPPNLLAQLRGCIIVSLQQACKNEMCVAVWVMVAAQCCCERGRAWLDMWRCGSSYPVPLFSAHGPGERCVCVWWYLLCTL